MFPRSVLISPLWARNRKGWARCHVGKVFVLVDDGEGAREEIHLEIRVEKGQLVSREEPLVDEGSGGEARDVELAIVRVVAPADRLLGPPTDDVELPLEGVGPGGPPLEEALDDPGFRGAGELPEEPVVVGDLPPAEDGVPFLTGDPLEGLDAPPGKFRVGGEEDHADRVVPPRGEGEGKTGEAEEGVGDPDEDPGAVAGGLVAPDRPPVLEVDEDPDSFFDDGMAGFRREGGDEPHAAGVMLLGGIVEAAAYRDAGGVQMNKSVIILQEAMPSLLAVGSNTLL